MLILATKLMAVTVLCSMAAGAVACGDDGPSPHGAAAPTAERDGAASGAVAPSAGKGGSPSVAPREAPAKTGLDTFGGPAPGSDARAVRALVRSFFAAIRVGDGVAACAMLSRAMRSEIDRVVASGGDDERCGETLLDTYANSYPGLLNPPLTPLRAGKVRIEEDFGYGFYRTPRVRRSVLTVTREHGAWKVRALGGPA